LAYSGWTAHRHPVTPVLCLSRFRALKNRCPALARGPAKDSLYR
jgi:hypothetical protein